jgi:hypothetical protein
MATAQQATRKSLLFQQQEQRQDQDMFTTRISDSGGSMMVGYLIR